MATNLPNPFNTLQKTKEGKYYYSLAELEKQGIGKGRRLPVSIRIMLESLLRHCDGKTVTEEDVARLADWDPKNPSEGDVPFTVSRVILQDFTGVPLLVDLAAMRDAVVEKGFKAEDIEPQVPVDLVVDHSVQVDRSGTEDAFLFNLETEFNRNSERYSFLKWGQQAFKTLRVVPPGIGIVHQVNLEYLASVVTEKQKNGATVICPDTLVGTDSHTTMVNGLGVVGWGVGGIEAEAAMLGQPVFLQAPEVIGFHLSGKLKEGVTATDLTLRITEILRKEQVVDKFIEFFGEGTASLTVADRATIANMSPEYGATIGFFPVDEMTLEYLKMTGRGEEAIKLIKDYLVSQGLFGIPKKGEIDYTKVLELDLNVVQPCVAGPKRPQDRIPLTELKDKFTELLAAPSTSGGYGKSASDVNRKILVHAGGSVSIDASEECGGIDSLELGNRIPGWSESEMVTNRPVTHAIVNPGYLESAVYDVLLTHGTVVIAAITSCTNTSNPSVMLGAGLLAKKAVDKGLKVSSIVKTSLAPGSRVVTDYLEQAGLQQYLNELGFHLVGYGCTTCIGNSGPLEDHLDKAIKDHDIVAASVLSGNRNFEARIHSSVKANFLMSPPLVVAFALAGRVDIDLEKDPLGNDKEGNPVYLRDIWPSTSELAEAMAKCVQPVMFQKRYAHIMDDSPVWKKIAPKTGAQYTWEQASTYIQQPPYFETFTLEQTPLSRELTNMRPLALFGDSVTTDHISPAGAILPHTPAGQYLLSLGVKEGDFNSYGSRRGNHDVMMRGTFANVRLNNKMAGGKEGGYTKLMPEGKLLTIFDASQLYAKQKTPLIIFAGKDYGMGSSRDWAAKGTTLLGVKVVVAQSFERIHRSNLIGMGVLPLQFHEGDSAETLGLTGEETFSILGLEEAPKPGEELILEITKGGKKQTISLLSRLDTATDIAYYLHGGIMPYVLRQILQPS